MPACLWAIFFEHEPPITHDAIVGNPPFVRYQNFTGAARSWSMEAALAQGVRLSGLTVPSRMLTYTLVGRPCSWQD